MSGYQTKETEFYPASLTALGEIKMQIGSNSYLRIENDLWYLDGAYALDGGKMLDAKIYDFDL